MKKQTIFSIIAALICVGFFANAAVSANETISGTAAAPKYQEQKKKIKGTRNPISTNVSTNVMPVRGSVVEIEWVGKPRVIVTVTIIEIDEYGLANVNIDSVDGNADLAPGTPGQQVPMNFVSK